MMMLSMLSRCYCCAYFEYGNGEYDGYSVIVCNDDDDDDYDDYKEVRHIDNVTKTKY